MKFAKTRWTCLAVALGLTAGVVLTGCAEKSSVDVKERYFGDVGDEERKTIEEHLAKAGIKGEIQATKNEGSTWLVDVMPPRPKDGKRRMPQPPDVFRVDKKTGKVQRF